MPKIPKHILAALQYRFHQLMRSRAARLIDQHQLTLPRLADLSEDGRQVFFPIPGMYGGFRYWLEGEGEETKLISVSFVRVVGGSGQRHEITAQGCVLLEEGFI